jgi:hypothetical protein
MTPEVIAALVSAIGSLILAIIGIFISFNAQKTANKASEDAKRVEQVRLKATDVGEQVLSKMAEVIISSETILFLLNHRKEKILTIEETKNYFVPVGKNASALLNLIYSSAIYTTEEIRQALNETLQPIFAGNIDFNQWQQFVNKLKGNHKQITTLFYETYLKGIF